jgi:hypothetical protein
MQGIQNADTHLVDMKTISQLITSTSPQPLPQQPT